MSLLSKVGSFNIDTTKTDGQTQSITDVGFQPKIVLFWWSGSTATGDAVSSGNVEIGFGVGNLTASYCSHAINQDALEISQAYSAQNNAASIEIYTDGTPTLNGRAVVSAFGADGFTITINSQFSNAYRISYLALGGTDLTNTYVGSAFHTVVEEYDVTDVGFQPDALITFGMGAGTPSSGIANLYFSIGMATNPANQGTISIYSQDAVDTSNTTGYGYDGEVGAYRGVAVRDAFVSFLANGFRMNHLASTSTRYYYYVCLKGGQYAVGNLNTRTDGNDISENVGFQPGALLFASANRALSTQGTSTDHARISIGAATSVTNRAVQAVSDEDNLAVTETARANYDSAVYAHITDDAIVALMDLKSIESDGFTCVMDDPSPTEGWVAYLAIGETGGDCTVETVVSTNTVVDVITVVAMEE